MTIYTPGEASKALHGQYTLFDLDHAPLSWNHTAWLVEKVSYEVAAWAALDTDDIVAEPVPREHDFDQRLGCPVEQHHLMALEQKLPRLWGMAG